MSEFYNSLSQGSYRTYFPLQKLLKPSTIACNCSIVMAGRLLLALSQSLSSNCNYMKVNDSAYKEINIYTQYYLKGSNFL